MSTTLNADTNGSGGVGTLASTAALTTVLQAIGQSSLAGNKQTPDVLAFEELSYPTTNAYSPTLPVIISCLDAAYPAATIPSIPPLTLRMGMTLATAPAAWSTTPIRERLGRHYLGRGRQRSARPIRFELEPVGSSTPFYLYVSHMLSSGGNRQTVEAPRDPQ